MNSTTSNLDDPAIYSQIDTTYNISSDVNTENMSQTSTSSSTTASLNMALDTNENQPMQQVDNPIQDDQMLHSQEAVIMTENQFFYRPFNDFQMYHLICKEIPLSFELVSQLINNSHYYDQSNGTYVFYHERTDSKKIYQMTCKMVSHRLLNKMIYGIEFNQCEQHQQEFSKEHQENLKFHLKNDLIYYITPKRVYDGLHWNLVQDSFMTNSNTSVSNNFPQHTSNILPFNPSRQYNSHQLIDGCYI